MTVVLTILLILSASILIAAAWAGCAALPQETTLEGHNGIEGLLPLHTQHFPQLRQALESADAHYVRWKVAKDGQRMWQDERRQILQRFLAGLVGDFAKLNQMRREIGPLASETNGRGEMARRWTNFCFRLNTRVISTQIALGGPRSMRRLVRLTERVASLSAGTEAAMARLEPNASQSEVNSHFSA
jgi:hypothetical protein